GPQLRQVLFEELKLPSLQKTPGGEPSTAQDVLEELALKHPLPALLLRHRQLAKLKSTYLDALPALVHPQDGRIHASFNQRVAARIFHVDEEAVDQSMRRVAKTVNFGVIYGLSPFGLAGRLGITQAEAAAFIDAYFREYAGVDRFITRSLEAAQTQGRVETIL